MGSPPLPGDNLVARSALERKLASIDLNLLVALDALLECRNVTHAARKMGQTQPAMSRSLARLRDLLGDDLLVRSSSGLKLTARGEYLSEIVPATMSHIRDVISAREKNVGVRLSMSAHLMPALLPHLMQSAPRENLRTKISTHKTPREGVSQLRDRKAQFLLGSAVEGESDIGRETMASEDFVTLVAFERHQLRGVRPTEPAFLELTHINLVEDGSELFPQVADALTDHGIPRSRLMEVPDVTSAALMASESRLALTIPRSIAGWLTKTLPLSAVHPPIAIQQQEVALSWLISDFDNSWRRLVDNIGRAAKEAIALDQASIRVMRLVSSEAG